MSAQLQRFIVATDDPARSTLYASYQSTLKVNLAGDVRNDRAIAFTIEPVISAAPGSSSLFTSDFDAADTFQVAVGLPDQAPTGGTFKLTVATSTTNLTALAYNIDAATLQTPVSVAMVAGGYSACTVTSLGNGVFRIRANSVGAIPTGKIVSDSANLVPLSGVIVSEVSLGGASSYYIYILTIRQQPLALATPSTILSGTVVSNTVTQAMSATLDAINTVSFTIPPVDGTFSVSAYALGVTTSCGVANPTMTAADFQALLENHPSLVDNVTVSQVGSSYVVQFIGAAGPKTITSSSIANPTVITTAIPHGYVSGMTVTHSSTNSTPNTDGARVVTVISPTTYSVPVNVTVAGTAGVTRDSTAPLLSVADINLVSPQGVSGTINFNTENLVEYLAGQTTYTVDLQFSITRTRSSGEYRNIFGPATIQIAKDIVDPTSMVPTPLASYYTSAQADARFGQLAAINVWTVDQNFSGNIAVIGAVAAATINCTGTVAGVIGDFSSYVKTDPLTVATLPAAATAGAGARSYVTDSNATLTAGIGATVAAGGANKVPVVSDGTNWKIG